jgi:ATP dependent DNA ligase domain
MNARNGLPKPLTYMLALVGQLSTRRTSLVQEIPKRCHEPGYDWTRKYPWIVEAALKNRIKHFVVDGEAVILGVDGVSDFNALHSGQQNEEVQLCAFDVLAMDGDDLRKLPLTMRKTKT